MTTPYYEDFGVTVHAGDCLNMLTELPDASVDSVVTDPPYELAFMGRQWDATGIAFNPDVWRECLRVLKPGGHLLAFGGSRTWHRLVVAVEDAGFEIRDSIAWLYATGYPKSLDVSKAIDKIGARTGDEVAALKAELRRVFDRSGLTLAELNERCGFEASGYLRTSSTWAKLLPSPEKWARMRDLIGAHEDYSDAFRAAERVVIGRRTTGIGTGNGAVPFIGDSDNRDITAPATDAARQWQGWGTALKPAFEPIVVARKPLAGTVAANVLEHGAGALNIDGCRVAAGQDYRDKCASVAGLGGAITGDVYGEWTGVRVDSAHEAGRWPTNVVLTHAATPDGVDLCVDECVPGCPVRELNEQSGQSVSRRGAPRVGAKGAGWGMTATGAEYNDTGGASRFFPVFRFGAKAPAAERPRVDGVAHPTVKPLGLMRWLVRLVTPPAGVVLDPFLGSGTTAQAARAEGFRCVGIERDETYLPLITARLGDTTPDLFGGPS